MSIKIVCEPWEKYGSNPVVYEAMVFIDEKKVIGLNATDLKKSRALERLSDRLNGLSRTAHDLAFIAEHEENTVE